MYCRRLTKYKPRKPHRFHFTVNLNSYSHHIPILNTKHTHKPFRLTIDIIWISSSQTLSNENTGTNNFPLLLGVVDLVLHDGEPGRRQLWDVLLGLVEVGHGGVQAAPGVLLGVVHLQSRRGAVSVLD